MKWLRLVKLARWLNDNQDRLQAGREALSAARGTLQALKRTSGGTGDTPASLVRHGVEMALKELGDVAAILDELLVLRRE